MIRPLLTLLLLSTLAAPAAAQTTTTPPSNDPPPLRVGPVTIGGYFQVDALKVLGDERAESVDNFRVRRGRLALGGDIAPKVAWSFSVEFTGTPHVRDAYLNVKFAPQLNVRFGQFYPALGAERLTSTSRLELIDRTRLTEVLTYERNPGIAILNAEPWKGYVTYALGVFNGTGMNRSDDNDAKDVAGRLALTAPAVPGLTVGVNGAAGRQPDGDRERAGVDVSYDRPAFKVIVEGLRETFDGVPDREGWYVMGVYRIRPAQASPHFRMAELSARYVTFEDPTFARPGTASRTGIPRTTRELQFGGNYYVNRNMRLMANGIVPADDRDAPDATLIARLQVIF